MIGASRSRGTLHGLVSKGKNAGSQYKRDSRPDAAPAPYLQCSRFFYLFTNTRNRYTSKFTRHDTHKRGRGKRDHNSKNTDLQRARCLEGLGARRDTQATATTELDWLETQTDDDDDYHYPDLTFYFRRTSRYSLKLRRDVSLPWALPGKYPLAAGFCLLAPQLRLRVARRCTAYCRSCSPSIVVESTRGSGSGYVAIFSSFSQPLACTEAHETCACPVASRTRPSGSRPRHPTLARARTHYRVARALISRLLLRQLGSALLLRVLVVVIAAVYFNSTEGVRLDPVRESRVVCEGIGS